MIFQDLSLGVVLLIFAGAAVVVWIGGVRLTIALDALAEKTGLGRLFVGMLLLGGITSLPEVANVITASAHGVPQLAINNVLGSAAINIVLLAAADAFIGRDGVTSVVADAATLMMSALCMIVLAAVAGAIVLGDFAVFGVGIGSLTITALSIAAFAMAADYGKRAPWALHDAATDAAPDAPDAAKHPLRALIWVSVLAAVTIFVAGYILSVAGEDLSQRTGLGAGFVGFLLIGFATSTPELSTIVTALRAKRYEMAFGQVLGTNFINLSLFALSDLVFAGGPIINELGRFEIVSALLGLVLIGVFLVGLLERRDATIIKMGYDSFAVILLFVCGAGALYALR